MGLLTKAAEDTRRFNKQASHTRSTERVKILANLNSVLQNPLPTVQEIEDAEAALTSFDEEDIRKILQKTRTSGCSMMKNPPKLFLPWRIVNHNTTTMSATLRWRTRSLIILQTPPKLQKQQQ